MQSRRGRRILVRPRVGEAGHIHRGDWRPLPVAAARRVAADLESPAVRRQLGKGGVTGGARLAGLASVTRQRLGGAGADREKGRGRSNDGGEG